MSYQVRLVVHGYVDRRRGLAGGACTHVPFVPVSPDPHLAAVVGFELMLVKKMQC